jgi:AcrR family transcriptional regulator
MTQHTDASSAGASQRPGSRARNPRGEGDKLRREILAAAIRLLSDEERMRPVSLSLREVAREAGITAPAIYLHFADKDEVARAAVEQLFGQLAAAMDQADEEAAGQPPARWLAAQAHAYCRFAQESPARFRTMFAVADAGMVEAETLEGLARRWRTAVRGLSEAGMRLTQSPEQAAVSVWSSVHGRLLLGGRVGEEWKLGDVHRFVDELADSLATVDTPSSRSPTSS